MELILTGLQAAFFPHRLLINSVKTQMTDKIIATGNDKRSVYRFEVVAFNTKPYNHIVTPRRHVLTSVDYDSISLAVWRDYIEDGNSSRVASHYGLVVREAINRSVSGDELSWSFTRVGDCKLAGNIEKINDLRDRIMNLSKEPN